MQGQSLGIEVTGTSSVMKTKKVVKIFVISNITIKAEIDQEGKKIKI